MWWVPKSQELAHIMIENTFIILVRTVLTKSSNWPRVEYKVEKVFFIEAKLS